MDTINFPFRCMGCGAELQGVAVSGACPACGHSVAGMLCDMSVDAASGAVNDDVPCTTCGYNLRTLAVSAACPECNAAVRDSLRREDIQLNSIPWLRRMCRGLMLLACAVPAAAALFVFESRLPRFASSWWPHSKVAACVEYLVQGLAVAVVCAGILCVTHTGRCARRNRVQARACRWARVLLAVAVFLELAVVFSRCLTPTTTKLGWWGASLVGGIRCLAFVAEMLVILCVAVRLRAVVAAAGTRGLGRAMSFVIWLCGFGGAAVALGGIAFYCRAHVYTLMMRQSSGQRGVRTAGEWLLDVMQVVLGIGALAELVLLVAFVVAFVALIECRIVLGRHLATAIACQNQNVNSCRT